MQEILILCKFISKTVLNCPFMGFCRIYYCNYKISRILEKFKLLPRNDFHKKKVFQFFNSVRLWKNACRTISHNFEIVRHAFFHSLTELKNWKTFFLWKSLRGSNLRGNLYYPADFIIAIINATKWKSFYRLLKPKFVLIWQLWSFFWSSRTDIRIKNAYDISFISKYNQTSI